MSAYKGSTPVKKGDKIELTIDGEVWCKAKVKHALASQFTCTYKKNDLFFFYSDKGATWRKISE